MKIHTPKAVWVVSGLGLLLGLSLGHNHRLQNRIHELETRKSADRVILSLESSMEPVYALQLRQDMHLLRESLHAEAEKLRALYERERVRQELYRREE